MDERIGIYAGSFDPFTKGHEDIVLRSFNVCDKLIVAIGANASKTSLFSVDERLEQMQEVLGDLNVEVSQFSGLCINYAKLIGARVLIRGIRSIADFEYETNMANINKVLASHIETVFLPTAPQLAIVSSSMVKEIARHGGDISQFVSSRVVRDIQEKLGFKK